MEINPNSIPWGVQNSIWLNPELPSSALQQLEDLGSEVLERKNLEGHLVLASSGSTVADARFLKLVFISQSAFLESARAVCQYLSISAKDTWLQCLPRFHVGGLSIEARQQVSSCQIAKMPTWNIADFRYACEQNSFQFVSLVPTQVYDIVNSQIRAPSSLKSLIVGGGFLNPILHKKALELDWKILFSYGMTETSSMVSLSENEMLKPLSGVSFSIDSSQRLGIKAPGLATGAAQWTAEEKWHFDKLVDENAWYWAQDRIEEKPEGIKLLGRSQDFVKIGGEGTDVQALRSLWENLGFRFNLDISKTALLPVPSERLGNEISLVLENSLLEDPVLVQNIVEEFARNVLPNQKIRSLHYIEAIPRSRLGKILWPALKSLLSERTKA